jgi:ketosteroid isomerase-like protein
MVNATQLEGVVRAYFAACNAADAAGIAACLTPDAVQYGYAPSQPMRGAALVSSRFKAIVEAEGRRWTVDRIVSDATRAEAVIQYSRFRTGDATVVRGAEWFFFDRASGLIREIHNYTPTNASVRRAEAGDETTSAVESDRERLELAGFDYAANGYPTALPGDLA